MKNLKKMFALLLAMVMVLGMSTLTAFADTTGSITITPPTNTEAGQKNDYKIYKVFDAVASDKGISYKVMDSKKDVALPAGFVTDAAGNVIHGTKEADGSVTPNTATELTSEEIAAIKAYVGSDVAVATATSFGTDSATATGLAAGYYFITTSTGTVVTIDSAKPNAQVNDKNVIQKPTKKITEAAYKDADGNVVNSGSLDTNGQNALASVGMTVKYEATVTKTKGAKNYIFHDKMDDGLTYNNDVKVYLGADEVAAANYDTTKASGDTITVKFTDAFIQSLADNTVITIKYSATVNSDALTVDPAKNTASLSYGDNNSVIKTTDTPKVYNAKFTVTKQDGNGQALAGAGFVLKNADGKYYNLTNKVVTWVDDIANATEYTSGADGAVPAFTGLANGTYTLVEKTVPAGYNKAADSTFTIEAGDYTKQNLEQASTVINKAGTELPSTGGMGTTLFYVVGGILVLAAGIMLVARKRMSSR